VLWVWVNYYDAHRARAKRDMRVEQRHRRPIGPLGQIDDGRLWLTNISYQGNIDSGKAIAGLLGTGSYRLVRPWDLFTGAARVSRSTATTISTTWTSAASPGWRPASRPPGMAAMAVLRGRSKAYAVALHGLHLL
jgi:hypothetical protein